MPARHRSRQRALQILYQADIRQQSVEAAMSDFYETLYSGDATDDSEPVEQPISDAFMETLVKGTEEHREMLDAVITTKSEHWRVERMPVVDRNILRMAVFEMREVKTPAPVVIDEAVELARQFSSDESIGFINGVLDAIRKSSGA
jgi:N utilization substance protein B